MKILADKIESCSYRLPCLYFNSNSISSTIANLPAIIGGSIGAFLLLCILFGIILSIVFRKRINSLLCPCKPEDYSKPYYGVSSEQNLYDNTAYYSTEAKNNNLLKQ